MRKLKFFFLGLLFMATLSQFLVGLGGMGLFGSECKQFLDAAVIGSH